MRIVAVIVNVNSQVGEECGELKETKSSALESFGHAMSSIVPFVDKLLGACRHLDCPRSNDASERH